jgi:hypothetical protein
MRRGWWAVLAVPLAVSILSACAPPEQKPAGAPPFETSRPLGASEQLTTSPPTTPAAVKKKTPAAAPTSITDPFACPEQTITPLSSAELRDALKNAQPGDVIAIEPGVYAGHFTIKSKGTAAKPIYLCGPKEATLDGRALNKGYVLHLDGAVNWRLSGFTVRNGLKGIMMDGGRSNVLQGLSVEETGDEGVHLRKTSVGNVVQGLQIRKTGKVHEKFGEGLYVGTAKSNWCDISRCGPDRSDRNQLLSNKITLTTAESIDVKEGTSKGVIAGNTFDGRGLRGDADSWVDVKGSYWTITENRGEYSPKDGYQTHQILKGWGDHNVFTSNTATMTGGARGFAFFLEKPLRNSVSCDNKQTSALKGLSNRPCTP